MNDAQEWGRLALDLCRDGVDPHEAERAARITMTYRRRERDPERRHWGPGDALPDPPPAAGTDLDGARWEHQVAGHGMYRMSAKDRRKHRRSSGDFEGVRPWFYLLDSEGPITEA
ncbi:hypothetical protein LCD36_04750 [Saccharopolyspora sp. 6T]|uniref:hypothetical protein n=1 Tax=Saccharopolyspora sp. 6T TaxID=2877238 RepID=UPI001CD561D9|nr:hypothetical protein [Saccharopolyspora sp. 6T]MCA1185761.1 hypothetical protein [Saccharopolyspora sp. 6T]